MALDDLTNKKFERLTVLKLAYIKGRYAYWLCQCSCKKKKKKIICGHSLIYGRTRSCGCLMREVNAKRMKGNQLTLRHGMCYTLFHNVWASMLERCNNQNNSAYKNYGGRGIQICMQWLKFENFRNDMYALYLEHKKRYAYTSIERIDNNGNYCKSNCCWATAKEQRANQRHITEVY